jgi:hypothetical protein
VPHHRRVVRERLPVGGGGGGLPRGGRARRQDRVQVARLHGVVHEQREIGVVAVAQCRSGGPVELDTADQRQAALDRAAGQLVPEGDGAVDDGDDPAPLRLGERVQPAEERGGELEVGVGGHHGELFERPLRGGVELVQPRQHGVHHGGGHVRVRRREHLGDEERVAARARQHGLDGVAPERGDPRGREAGERDPGRGRPGEVAEQRLQGMPRRDVVRTAGEHDERVHAVQPPRELAQRVEGGVVGPVHVLDQQERRPLAREAGQQRLQQVVAGAVGERGPQRRWAVPGDVAQGAEGPRGEQVVAAAAQHGPVGRQVGRERAHQCGLADACLAGDERDRARTRRDPLRRPAQDVELRGAFHQRRHDQHRGTSNIDISDNARVADPSTTGDRGRASGSGIT